MKNNSKICNEIRNEDGKMNVEESEWEKEEEKLFKLKELTKLKGLLACCLLACFSCCLLGCRKEIKFFSQKSRIDLRFVV